MDRLRARHGWLDHVVKAYQRFSKQKGTFFAAGLTYYTIFSLFPLLMVGYAVAGYMLSRRPQLMGTLEGRIRTAVSGELGQQLVDLMNSAIDARASVGVIGLLTAAWAGLGWMYHLREALSEMWLQATDPTGYVRTKVSDLLAMLSTFLVITVTIALSALGQAGPMSALLRLLHIPEFSIFDEIFRGVSVLVSLLVSWLLFTWMIARLPRLPGSFVTSMRAGLMAAVGFEVFKQLGSIYLQRVVRSPAGATFGPVLGLMVFAFVTWSLLLFATAWAATASDDERESHVDPPAPAIIRPRIQLQEGPTARQTLAAMAAGAVGALTLSRLTKRRRR
ncbi:inner membrane protein YhjD [Mycobacterium asiaticum]|uniref:Inner membrane protein YhjD n=1 Tax=Mycobacterium asiaticum TaxID=1790 RepID=A0A1A3N950_MYCAS|nr:inner membrane protein YhjD [Mycobacterium asiaticum]